ncbi:uncharacterized protein LOC103723674 [Phoenix dactylifera]|uniref:Uncharacterized protein LOC103723674 n=1 Tax=Phoenix dactylifera TaxID=42345 RepID=A0A8B7D4W5_PHODC|nr:uncharacterized protein LOC103723674 [Phoenix dactylifera]XP_038980062.1 uncharacterized protein LOC103723674 [Phoenix dactylifera]
MSLSPSRPERSDAHVPPDEEVEREAEAREYFQESAPKRHPKPSRSDYSSDALQSSDPHSIPELDKFRDLQKLVSAESHEAAEEYVETEYYKDLDCIDKQHHTTGTGFIGMEKSTGSSFELTPESDAPGCHPSCKGNPATNEWIPSVDMGVPASHKPNGSDA